MVINGHKFSFTGWTKFFTGLGILIWLFFGHSLIAVTFGGLCFATFWYELLIQLHPDKQKQCKHMIIAYVVFNTTMIFVMGFVMYKLGINPFQSFDTGWLFVIFTTSSIISVFILRKIFPGGNDSQGGSKQKAGAKVRVEQPTRSSHLRIVR